MLPVQFSAAKTRSAPDGAQEHEMTVSGSDRDLLQAWIKGSTIAAICAYFKEVTSGLAERQLQHYHFKIYNGRFDTRTQSQTPKWHCTVFYGDQDAAADASAMQKGPLQVPRCMSCDMDCPLLLGITGEDPDSTTTASQKPLKAAAAAAATSLGVPAAEWAAGEHSSQPEAAHDAQHVAQPGGSAQSDATAQPEQPLGQGMPNPTPHQQQQQSPLQDQGSQQKPPSPQQQQQQVAQQQQQGAQQQQQQQHIMRSRDSLVRESQHCRVWFDAKGRPMFVVTPKQHIEQLSGLSDAQLVDLFRTAVAVLDEMGCGCISMILNQGNNRNHAHLHLKVKVHEREFERASVGWPDQHKQQLRAIRAFRDALPPEHRGTHEAFMLRMKQARRGGGGRRGGDRGGRGRGRGSDGDWGQGQQQQQGQHLQHQPDPAAAGSPRATKRQHTEAE